MAKIEIEALRCGKKVKVKITVGNKKIIAGVGFEPNHVWAPCCEQTESCLRRWALRCE
jgi:hypothetical protein